MKTADATVIIERTRDALRVLGRGRGPVIVGPWLSEVGFELLYWVPFLRWACAFAGLRREDIWIVSRGGPQSWYQDIGDNYLDVLEFYTPEDFARENERRIDDQSTRATQLGMRAGSRSPKQQEISVFDQAILLRVTERLGGNARLLHPSLMYRYFRPYWKRKAEQLYERSTHAARLKAYPDVISGLPKIYVAMKWYASNALPDTAATRSTVQHIVESHARHAEVVLLQSGARYDDHGDFPIDPHPRVHRVVPSPLVNLDVQTAVISGAASFVGTYGGFAYLAPFLGVRSVALFAKESFRKDHRKLMTELAARTLRVPFTVAHIDSMVQAGRGRHYAA